MAGEEVKANIEKAFTISYLPFKNILKQGTGDGLWQHRMVAK